MSTSTITRFALRAAISGVIPCLVLIFTMALARTNILTVSTHLLFSME